MCRIGCRRASDAWTWVVPSMEEAAALLGNLQQMSIGEAERGMREVQHGTTLGPWYMDSQESGYPTPPLCLRFLTPPGPLLLRAITTPTPLLLSLIREKEEHQGKITGGILKIQFHIIGNLIVIPSISTKIFSNFTVTLSVYTEYSNQYYR